MRLRTRFGLALGAVLLVATALPLLVLYLLGASGLVEATYVAKVGDARATLAAPREIPSAEAVGRAAPTVPSLTAPGEESEWPLPPSILDRDSTGRIPILAVDPVTGEAMSQVRADLQRVVLTSPVFHFRVDLPAGIVIGSLPLFGLGAGLLLSVWMSRSVTRPISDLAHAARAIGERDLGYRVKSEGSQELQDLAQSFNRMAGELERAEAVRRNLMADVAHELRTPLTILDGNLRAMLDGVRPLDEDGIATLMEETHHLNRLVEDLRLLSQAEAEKLTLSQTRADLADLVRETTAHFSPLTKEREIGLEARLDGELVHPTLDADRILQVLHNLVANALAHTPRGGRITISLWRADDPPRACIAVEDNGAGIATEALAHVFDRFYRAGSLPSGDRGGAGLGLAIVRALVEAHGGTVRAASQGPGQGSTFTVDLPFPRGADTPAG